MFMSNSIQTPCNLQFQYILVFQRTHSLFRACELPERPDFDIFQEALFCTLASSANLVLNVFPIKAGQYLCRVFKENIFRKNKFFTF